MRIFFSVQEMIRTFVLYTMIFAAKNIFISFSCVKHYLLFKNYRNSYHASTQPCDSGAIICVRLSTQNISPEIIAVRRSLVISSHLTLVRRLSTLQRLEFLSLAF